MVMDAIPSPQSVGREFVRQYYTLLNKAPDHLHRFYNNNSSFIHGGGEPSNRDTTVLVIGQKHIYNKIQQLRFRDCHAKISQVDAQSTLGNGVVVQVTGELSNDGQPMRRFTQTFVLAAQTPKKYYVHNDIFRYQDVYSDDEADGETRSDVDDEVDVDHQPLQILDGGQNVIVQQQLQQQPMIQQNSPPPPQQQLQQHQQQPQHQQQSQSQQQQQPQQQQQQQHHQQQQQHQHQHQQQHQQQQQQPMPLQQQQQSHQQQIQASTSGVPVQQQQQPQQQPQQQHQQHQHHPQQQHQPQQPHTQPQIQPQQPQQPQQQPQQPPQQPPPPLATINQQQQSQQQPPMQQQPIYFSMSVSAAGSNMVLQPYGQQPNQQVNGGIHEDVVPSITTQMAQNTIMQQATSNVMLPPQQQVQAQIQQTIPNVLSVEMGSGPTVAINGTENSSDELYQQPQQPMLMVKSESPITEPINNLSTVESVNIVEETQVIENAENLREETMKNAPMEPKTYANLFKSDMNTSKMSFSSAMTSPTSNMNYNNNNNNNNTGGMRNTNSNSYHPRGQDSRSENVSSTQKSMRTHMIRERRTSNTAPFSDSCQLFLGNVPHHATEEELKQIFSKFGTVVDLRIHSKSGMKMIGNRAPPNYGFITYEDPDAVQICLSNQPLYFPHNAPDGQRLNVEEKKNKRPNDIGSGPMNRNLSGSNNNSGNTNSGNSGNSNPNNTNNNTNNTNNNNHNQHHMTNGGGSRMGGGPTGGSGGNINRGGPSAGGGGGGNMLRSGGPPGGVSRGPSGRGGFNRNDNRGGPPGQSRGNPINVSSSGGGGGGGGGGNNYGGGRR